MLLYCERTTFCQGADGGVRHHHGASTLLLSAALQVAKNELRAAVKRPSAGHLANNKPLNRAWLD
jgi:hypothetical protein